MRSEAGAVVVPFRKHVGKTIASVFAEDPSYVYWLASRGTSVIHGAAQKFLAELISPPPRRLVVTALQAIRHHLTLEEAQEMWNRQGRKCAICGAKEPGGPAWHIDHQHSCCPDGPSCGQCVRGILCHRCNTFVVPSLEAQDLNVWEAALRYLRDGYLTVEEVEYLEAESA